jgi:hypothetical protein
LPFAFALPVPYFLFFTILIIDTGIYGNEIPKMIAENENHLLILFYDD